VPAKTIRTPKKPKETQVFGKGGVSYTFPQGDAGPMQINVDFGSAPEPLQYYYADSVYLAMDEDLRMAALSFGRRDVNANKFAGRIEVVMPANGLRYFWISSREVEGTVDKILASSRAVLGVRSISAPDTSAEGTFFANMIFMAVGEGESVLDFYQLSAREVHFAKLRRKNMQLHAAIRVFMSTVLTKFFFSLLRPYAGEQATIQQTGGEDRRAARSREIWNHIV
jgi:hypothetical protein